MYILIDFINQFGKQSTMAFENFADLKDSVINDLDISGWTYKEDVDLRNLKSCVDYLISRNGARKGEIKKSISYKKFNEYRYGEKARNL